MSRYNKTIQKIINFDDVTKESIKDHNPNLPQISDNSYSILVIGGSGSGKTNSLFNLINQQTNIDKMYSYTKDPYETKFLIKKRESTNLKYFNDSKAFIEYSNDMDDIYKNIEEYNPNMKRKILIVFDDMIADMLSNKKLNPTVTEVLIRGRKLNRRHNCVTKKFFFTYFFMRFKFVSCSKGMKTTQTIKIIVTFRSYSS